MQGYLRAMRRYASFRGCAGRAEFWQFTLWQIILTLAASIADVALGLRIAGLVTPLWFATYLVHLAPGTAVTVRRLHDTGRSGWWWWLWWLPILGWLVLLVFFVQRTKPGTALEGRPAAARDWGPIMAPLIILYGLSPFIVRALLYQSFYIPAASGMPSLLVGDYLFASKFAYGYSKYSFVWPFGAPQGRVWGVLPKRGDVAIFRHPTETSSDYVKRVIGLPGDVVGMDGEILSINGQKASYAFVRESGDDPTGRTAFVYDETLPGGRKHLIQTLDHRLDEPGQHSKWQVGEDAIFVLGDNRDNSADSRFWGAVPLENLIGRADVIYFSMKTVPGPSSEPQQQIESPWEFWRWPSTVRWERMLSQVH